MKERNVWLILVMVLVIGCTVQAQIITEVVRAGGASGDRDPYGIYVADSNTLPTEPGGLIAGNLIFSDRTYHWANVPAQLNGVEFIRTFNSDKDNWETVTYAVTTSMPARVFVGFDERFGDPGNPAVLQALVDAAVADFAAAGTFTDSGMGVLIREDGNELLLYWADLDPNTYVFHGAPSGNNFITIGAIDPALDPIPIVNAGPDRVAWDWPAIPDLNGSVDDADPLDGPAGTLTYGWTEDSGNPALGVIDDPGSLTSSLSIVPVSGDEYTFTLTASDDGGTTTVEDSVTLKFKVFGVDTQVVLLVSDVADVAGHSEEPLITWLGTLGYDVDTSGMGGVFREDEGPFDDGTTANDALVLALSNTDLIFFSSTVDDGEYDSNGSGPGWNAIPVPLLAQAAGLAEGQSDGGDTRFGWFLSDTRGGDDTDDMELVPDEESVQLWDWTDSPVFDEYWRCPDDIRTSEEVGVSGDAVIKAFNDGYGRRIFWLDVPKGTDCDADQAEPDPGQHGITGERRVLFGHWRYDNLAGDGSTRGPGGGQAYWDSYMLPVYKEYLQDILFDLIPNPTYNPGPKADAGPKQAIYLDETDTVTLAGTVTDEDPALGDPGVLTFDWVKMSGPGTVTFDPADTTDQLAPDATFGSAGRYELLLTATDGTTDANDVVVIVVQDKELVGHWPFDVDYDDYSGNDNHGTAMGFAALDGDAAVGAGSLQLGNTSGETEPNCIFLGDAPELDMQALPEANFTASAWIKTSNSSSQQVIIQKGGDDSGGIRWYLRTNGGEAGLTTDDDDNKEAALGGDIADGLWHFVLGVCDDEGIHIYVDGVFQDDDSRGGDPGDIYDLSGTSQRPGFIGAGTRVSDTGSDATKGIGFDGRIDEVRVYNYALSEADILALAAAGPIVATVDAGADEVFAWKVDRELTLSGVVTDNGASPETNVIGWSTESGPDVASFTDATDPGTTVTFPVAGVYVLKLTVTDPDAPGDLVDTVEITVVPPTCAEVLADGLGMPGDIAGGGLLGDEPDCYVGLDDLAAILANWAECNVPADPSCDWPF